MFLQVNSSFEVCVGPHANTGYLTHSQQGAEGVGARAPWQYFLDHVAQAFCLAEKGF